MEYVYIWSGNIRRAGPHVRKFLPATFPQPALHQHDGGGAMTHDSETPSMGAIKQCFIAPMPQGGIRTGIPPPVLKTSSALFPVVLTRFLQLFFLAHDAITIMLEGTMILYIIPIYQFPRWYETSCVVK